MRAVIFEISGLLRLRFRFYRQNSRQPDREGRALSSGALHGDVPAHHAAKLKTDVETQSGAAETPGRRHLGLREGLEELLPLFRHHTDPGVGHPEHDLVDSCPLLAEHLQGDHPVVGELGGVRKKVQQHLAHAGHIRMHASDSRWAFQLERVAVLGHQRLHGRHDVVDERQQLERFGEQLHLSGFDLREVEHVVNQRQEVLAGRVDLPEIWKERRIAPLLDLFLEHLAVTDNRVERRAQLVTHAGQELALGTVGTLRRPAGRQQLRDVVVQRHEADTLVVHDHGHAEHLHIDQ